MFQRNAEMKMVDYQKLAIYKVELGGCFQTSWYYPFFSPRYHVPIISP